MEGNDRSSRELSQVLLHTTRHTYPFYLVLCTVICPPVWSQIIHQTAPDVWLIEPTRYAEMMPFPPKIKRSTSEGGICATMIYTKGTSNVFKGSFANVCIFLHSSRKILLSSHHPLIRKNRPQGATLTRSAVIIPWPVREFSMHVLFVSNDKGQI